LQAIWMQTPPGGVQMPQLALQRTRQGWPISSSRHLTTASTAQPAAPQWTVATEARRARRRNFTQGHRRIVAIRTRRTTGCAHAAL